MKRLLLTLVAAIALCGTVTAQYHSDIYEDRYVGNPYLGDYDYVIPFIQIDGVYLSLEDNYSAFEVGAFIDGEVRGGSFLIDDGEDYPFTEISVYRPEGIEGQTVTFKLYDHENEIEYIGLTTLVNGQDYADLYNYWPPIYDLVPVLNFTLATKHIEGFASDYDPVTNPRDHYYLIASPVAEDIAVSTIPGMTEGEYDLYTFDQTGDVDQNEWINCYGVEGFEMENGVGYLYAHDEEIDLTFAGTLYVGDGTVNLSYNDDAYWKGWNLVGNPFLEPAYIDRDYYGLQNGSEIVPVLGGSAIDAMCGIFVLATGPDDTELTFSKTASKSNRSSLSLNVSRANRVLDRTIVRFGGDRDLPKFQLNANSTKVYIPMEGEDYAIVSAEGMGEMPVNFRAEKSGSYTISAKGEEVNFTYLHLIDNMTGADVDLLSTPSYSFEASTTDYESRFRLLFATGSSEEGDNFGFINGAGNLSIYGIEGEATLQVMDVNGRVLSTETFSGSYEKSLNVAAGIYMLRLTHGDNVKVQKMVIR